MIDYRNFSFSKRNDPSYRHLKLLLYWPIYGLAFLILERGLSLSYHTVHCSLDDLIPFCEYFLIPYYFWFVFLIGMLLYTLLFDVSCFRKYMTFIILTYSVTCLIYLIYPTAQELRPVTFARQNWMTKTVTFLYAFDTNTNVCPSLHVVGSFAVLFASWHTPRFSTFGWRAFFWIAALLISASTVFLKQHSVVDIAAALALCIVAYPLVYSKKAIKFWNPTEVRPCE